MPHEDTDARRMPAALLSSLVLVAVVFSTSGLAQRVPAWGLEWVEPTPLDPEVAARLFIAYDTGRYAEFDRLAGTLAASVINPFEFEADAARWMDAAADPRRAAFVAAAVALELASTSVRGPAGVGRPERTSQQQRMAIQLRYVLAELGCAWLRDHPSAPAEEFWHEAYAGLARGAGGQGGQGGILVQDWKTRWAELGRMSPRLVQEAARQRREYDSELRRQHQALLTRLRRQAARVSRSSRIEPSRFRFDHNQHTRARFPDSPLPLFLEATLREGMRTNFPDTLLDADAGFAPVWIEQAEVDRIAAGGAREVRAVPPNRRMDRASAERLIRIVPEPEESVQLHGPGGGPWSAALRSLVLWDIAEGFQAVPVRAPIAAEAVLRLGQTYARLARPDLALAAFARAEALAATPYERYLARVLAGAVFVRLGRQADAIVAFQGALQAVPRAQSASFALAPLLLEVGARDEAAAILAAAARLPLADDPLERYWTGDPSRESRALARLREEARR